MNTVLLIFNSVDYLLLPSSFTIFFLCLSCFDHFFSFASPFCHHFPSLPLSLSLLSPFSSFSPLLFPFLGLGGLLLPGTLGSGGRGGSRGAGGGSSTGAWGIRVTTWSLTGISVNETKYYVNLINFFKFIMLSLLLSI